MSNTRRYKATLSSTPKEFANFSPGFLTLGNKVRHRLYPERIKVTNGLFQRNESLVAPWTQGRNPGLKLANTFGV
jgi:hypothetical protein